MGRYTGVKRGWADDLADGNYYQSGWERDFARFLNLLQAHGVVEGWQYEPMEFSFQGLGYKRGPFTYKPDFAVRFSENGHLKLKQDNLSDILEIVPGKTVFFEVKGQETGRDRNKWRRFRKHTDYELQVIDRQKMINIQARFRLLMPEWESNIY